MSDFYSTMAQVLPLFLLALIWDSAYLERLRGQRRQLRRIDPDGVRFWSSLRVRALMLAVAAVVMISTIITFLVLAGVIPNSYSLRIFLCCGLAFVLATLMGRIYFDVIAATAQQPPRHGPDVEDDGKPGAS